VRVTPRCIARFACSKLEQMSLGLIFYCLSFNVTSGSGVFQFISPPYNNLFPPPSYTNVPQLSLNNARNTTRSFMG
jgi:hypothetical protein